MCSFDMLTYDMPRMPCWGVHIHMMSAQRGKVGDASKAIAVRKLSKGVCVKMQTRGEGDKK